MQLYSMQFDSVRNPFLNQVNHAGVQCSHNQPSLNGINRKRPSIPLGSRYSQRFFKGLLKTNSNLTFSRNFPDHMAIMGYYADVTIVLSNQTKDSGGVSGTAHDTKFPQNIQLMFDNEVINILAFFCFHYFIFKQC